MPTIFSTHTEGRNNYEVLENCTTTRNLWEKINEMDYKEAVSRWGEWGVWGAYTDLIWLEMGSSAAITDKDDKVGQAIPTICTYNWQTLKLYYHKKYTLLYVSVPGSHIQGFPHKKEFWLSLRK